MKSQGKKQNKQKEIDPVAFEKQTEVAASAFQTEEQVMMRNR